MIAYIGAGSNLGDRKQYLYSAVERLHQHPAVYVEQCSSIYETAPVGLEDQPYFLNMVVAVRSDLEPLDLLAVLLNIEQTLGRVRDIRWGPRTIDLDLLMYGQLMMRTERLELPHPRMHERAFVMIPLVEIGEQALEDFTILKAYDHVDGKEDVHLWRKTNWLSESGHFAN